MDRRNRRTMAQGAWAQFGCGAGAFSAHYGYLCDHGSAGEARRISAHHCGHWQLCGLDVLAHLSPGLDEKVLRILRFHGGSTC